MQKKALIILNVMLLAGCGSQSAFLQPSATPKSDTGAPFINVSQYTYETTVNHPINFSNITGYDDVDGLMKVSVEGYIDYSKPGEYYLTLTCTDTSENEAEVPITVDVLEETYASENPAPVQDFNATPAPTASTCDDANAKDRNSPCSVLLDADAQAYETLYLGEEGKQACLAAADAVNGQAADPAAVKVCEPLNRNDGTFWGYGLKTANQ